MELGLEGRVALVTGGAVGIGAAIAETLAGEGATVWLADRDEPNAERKAAELASRGLEVRAVRVDVTDADAVAATFRRAMADTNRLDILVCNAGILKMGPFRES